MRTTLDIDAELIEEAMRLSGRRTRAAAVEAALREYVRLEEDWRALREAELDEPG